MLTFKNSNLGETVKEISIDRILLETDSPYLAPTQHRGEKNEPKYIPLIAEDLAKKLNMNLEDLSVKINENISEIFDIKLD